MINEQICEHNYALGKSCDRPGGGESCAFDGAFIVLNPITDAAHLIHGPIACCGNSYEGRGSLSSGSRLYRYGFTTDMTERDIVYGGEEKLRRAIKYIAERYTPAAIFVYSTCIPALTGEDVENVCTGYDIPVIPVIVPGFLGHKNLGNRLAGEVLLEHVIGRGSVGAGESPLPWEGSKPARTINLIGEYNIAGELWDILPLFEKMGVTVQAKITGDSTFREIASAHQAEFNLLVCGRAMINVAKGMEERYGIPFKEVSFYGMQNTENALRETGDFFGLQKQVEEVIRECRGGFDIRPYIKKLKSKRAVVYSGGVKSWSIISALQDLGMEVVGCGTKKSSLSDIAKIKNLIGEERILNDVSPKNLLAVMEQTKADILIAGGRNQYLAYKEKIPFLDINQERHTPYAGYQGLVNLAEDIIKTTESPVWGLAKKEAPWKNR